MYVGHGTDAMTTETTMMVQTIGEFRALTKDVPDDAAIVVWSELTEDTLSIASVRVEYDQSVHITLDQ